MSLLGCLVLLATAGLSSAERNLLFDPDMSRDDGLGVPIGWEEKIIRGTLDGASVSAQERTPGPDGSPVRAVTLRFPRAEVFLRQHPLTLVPGETYRMSAWVRTAGLGDNKVALTCWDAGWNGEVWSERFPSDTNGKWQRVEWTGKMVGTKTDGFSFAVAGKTGDGQVEICGLSLSPVSEKAVAQSRGADFSSARPIMPRSVPIDPLLARVSADNARLTFYNPGHPTGGIAAAELTFSVDGKSASSAKFGPDHRAVAKMGGLVPGEHRIAVGVRDATGAVVATNGYPFRANGKPPVGPPGRVLNNFVTELHAGPLRSGDVPFFCPKDGWVWMAFEDCEDEDATGRLDDCLVAVIRRRPSERHLETMRYLRAGNHVLRIRKASGGTLRIHSVKTLLTNAWTLSRDGVSLGRYRNPYEYFRRYFFHVYNTVNPYYWHEGVADRDGPEDGFYLERGIRILSQQGLPCVDKSRLSADGIHSRLMASQAAREGYPIEVDENGLHAHLGPRTRFHYADALWRLLEERPRQPFHTDWCDSARHVFDDRRTQTSEISAIVNSGSGTGMLFPEVYCPPLTNLVDSIERGEGHFKDFVRSVGDFVPGAKGSVLFFFATYINLGGWCDYPHPETDIKFHYAHFIRTLATDPDFKDEIGGLALGGWQSGEEEVRRWFSKCVRHYCIEGRTDDLAAAYGFKHIPGLLKNCDFASGLDGWTAVAADGGGLAAEGIAGYGTKIQCRKGVPAGTGDGVVVFTHSGRGPNELSQVVDGLEPGRCYALMYCTADYDDVVERRGSRPDEAFGARLEGAEELGELGFVHETGNGGKDGQRRIQMLVHRQVFRATASSARLVFSDWKTKDVSGAKDGVRRVLNYVIFRPYYNEGDEDVEFLRKIFRGRK